MSTDNWLPDLMELNSTNPNANWNPMPPPSSTDFLEEDRSFNCVSHLTEAQPSVPTFPIQDQMQMYNNNGESLLPDQSFEFESSNGMLFASPYIIFFDGKQVYTKKANAIF